jgi:hypothetical protein
VVRQFDKSAQMDLVADVLLACQIGLSPQFAET